MTKAERGNLLRRLLASPLIALALAGVPTGASADAPAAPPPQDVLFVGNNWDGTADVIDVGTFTPRARLNIIPDLLAREAEIRSNPAKLGYFLAIRELIGEGHDQYVDDMFSSADGRQLYVSRPSFADVIALDMATGTIAWRVAVDGYRADHMGISPDGTQLLVSASTERMVDVIDPRLGVIVGRFPSGDTPHENNFSADGARIFHASIGRVYTPVAEPEFSAVKGDRWFEIVDADTLQVVKQIDMGEKLDEAGFPGMSSAVRPMALSPDELFLYFQVSFFHGFVEYDLTADRVRRVAVLPQSDKAKQTPREQYVLNSAHHGLVMNPAGTKLCVAGTMSDYAAIVSRESLSYTIIPVGERPYWATNSGDGHYCFISVAGDDRVSVISYDTAQEVARIPVGDHPQRMRMGKLAAGLLP